MSHMACIVVSISLVTISTTRMSHMACIVVSISLVTISTTRMSHMACEIFTSGVGAIVNELSADERFINLFWEFLDKKEKLNPLIGSFLSKVISVLLTHHCALVSKYVY